MKILTDKLKYQLEEQEWKNFEVEQKLKMYDKSISDYEQKKVTFMNLQTQNSD